MLHGCTGCYRCADILQPRMEPMWCVSHPGARSDGIDRSKKSMRRDRHEGIRCAATTFHDQHGSIRAAH